jgi:biotin/methionine sulfoxide reductase
MTAYTQAHWGIYEVSPDLRLSGFAGDPDPSPIGLHQLDPALQALRVRRPAVRRSVLQRGPGSAPEMRGREPFVEVDWDEALDLVAGELGRVRAAHGNKAIFGGSYGWGSAGRFHHAQSQVHRFLNSIGGYVRHADTYSLGAGRVLMPHIVAGMDQIMSSVTSWDVMAKHTRLFLTFGGVPWKNTQISSGGAGDHRVAGGLRAMAEAGVRFVNVSPVADNLETGGAVEWVPIRPNTDAAMLLAMCQTLLAEGLLDRAFLGRCCSGFATVEAYLSGAADGVVKSPAWASAICGVPAEVIAQLARDAAASRTMLNVTWSLQRSEHGEQPYWAVVTLAGMLGQIGLPGGGFAIGYGATNKEGSPQVALPGPTLPQGRNAVAEFIPVARISDMLLHPGERFAYNGGEYSYPDIRLVYWAGGNPFHHHQDLNRLMRAWQKPETVVVHEQYWTATAKFADVVLPATIMLERDDIGYATREGFLVAMRQAMPPTGEARNDFAIFSALAARLGAEAGYTEGRSEAAWIEHLYADCRAKAAAMGVKLPDFATFWRQGIIDLSAHAAPVVMLEAFRADPAAHPLNTESGLIVLGSERIAGFGLADCPGHAAWLPPTEWLGAVGDYPLHLLSDQPARRLHSQLDASPHSMAGKVAGREPIYLNPADAAARGIADGDLVEVFNGRGRTLAGAIVSAALMPGVARLATGAWFDHDWQTGIEKHGNPNTLTRDLGASGLSQGCTAQTCLVEVRRADGPAPAVTAHRLPELVGR